MSNHIKIQGTSPRIQYVADGNLTSYEFPFAIFKTSDIDVYFNDKVQDSDTYTVTMSKNIEGGEISFETAPTSGTIITIVRNLAIKRTTTFQEGGALRAKVLNKEFDYQMACQQQIADNLNRSMVLPPYAVDTDVDLTLPTPSAGKAIVWNSDGMNLENSTIKINELESTLKGYKESAEHSSIISEESAKSALQQVIEATKQADIATEKAQEAVSTLASKANQDMDNLSVLGKQMSANLAMPSDTYIDYTLTDRSFTAPANGYYCAKANMGTNSMIKLENSTNGMMTSYTNSTNDTRAVGVLLPVKKDAAVLLTVNQISPSMIRFIYAQGEI